MTNSNIIFHKINSYLIEEKSDFCLKEISNGIYYVKKGPNKNICMNSDNVIKLLNSKRKTYVIGKDCFYSNFNV